MKLTVLKLLWSRNGCSVARTVLSRSFLVLAVATLIYWLLCGVFCGFGISGLIVWPAAAVLLVALSLWISDKPPFRRLRTHCWLRRTVTVFLVAVMLYCAVVLGLIVSGMTATPPQNADYIIVLGAKVNGERPSLALHWRIQRAYEYLSQNPGTLAILSGGKGQGESISEAESMYRELTALGIAPSRLILEDKSTSTEENIRYSYAKMPEGEYSVGVVTNNFHVWRALRVADKVGGQELYGIPAAYPNILIVNYVVREIITITFYLLTGKI